MTRNRRAGLDTNAIVQEAILLADEIGYDKLTLAALAARLGIKTPSLYNHIQGMEDLRQRIAIQGLQKLYAHLNLAVHRENQEESILTVAIAYVSFANDNPGLYAATLHSPDSQVPEWNQLGEQIVALISDMIRSYGLEPNDVIHWVRGYRSLLHGYVSLKQAGAFGMPIDLNESLRYMLKTYMIGIDQHRSAVNDK